MTALGIRLCLAAAIVSTAGVAGVPAAAQSNVLERWFGPPKGEQRPVRRPKPKRQAAPGVPPIAAVPVPDERPRRAGEPAPTTAPGGEAASATSGPGEATPASEAASEREVPPADSAKSDAVATGAQAPAGEASRGAQSGAETPDPSKPLPEPRPETAAAGAAPAAQQPSTGAPASAGEPAAEPKAGSPDVPLDAPKPEAGTAEAPADPRATAEKPVDEIPVPEQRPAEPTPAETAAPGPAATATKPDAATASPEPEPEDAPNSTDKLKARVPTISPAETVLAAAAIEDAEACEAELKRRGVAFTVGESISEGECGVLRPVNVTRLSSGVKVSPKTQMLCRTALALDDWMTRGVVPAAKADLPGRKLTEFRHASTYVCRPRASERGISEHARGSAIDIAAFVFEDGKEIGIAAQAAGTPEAKFQDAIRAAACGPFRTVLGPGTDADHATHFHLDIAARRNGSTYCK